MKWWLSYVDEDGFNGGCFIDAEDFLSACSDAIRNGGRPKKGGHVSGHEFPDEIVPANAELNRTYTEKEVERLWGAVRPTRT